MLKKNQLFLFIIVFLIFISVFTFIPKSSEVTYLNREPVETPKISGTLEGAENVLITKIRRNVNISSYGLVNIEDLITVKNNNLNPITSVYIGISSSIIDDLVYYEAKGSEKSTLSTEKSNMIMNGYIMMIIYFNTPLLPQQSKTIYFYQTFKEMVDFVLLGNAQNVNFEGLVFPALPYRANGDITAHFQEPLDTTHVSNSLGTPGTLSIVDVNFYDISGISANEYLEPFLENLVTLSKENMTLSYSETYRTKLEVASLKREIYFSPWGIIKVKENYIFENLGVISVNVFTLNIPGPAKKISVYDDLGEITGITISPSSNYTELEYKELTIALAYNRVTMTPKSRFLFTLEYHLPIERYTTTNWFQQSVMIDLLTSTNDFLGRNEEIRVMIDGAVKVDSYTNIPNSIENTQSSIIFVYTITNVSPLERKVIQFTYTVDVFDVFIRPIIFILIIAFTCSAYVVVSKSKKKEKDSVITSRAQIPKNEIREFCSLYEEKIAFILEIRDAEEKAKRKKIAKKNLRNILNKNNSKITEIETEIVPFRKVVREIGAAFETIVKKLELLEAEGQSVKDSLKLLETRYKQGKLPSRAAFVKLSDDFLKRRRRIDRSLDKLIQQLRSYLL